MPDDDLSGYTSKELLDEVERRKLGNVLYVIGKDLSESDLVAALYALRRGQKQEGLLLLERGLGRDFTGLLTS